MDKRRADLAAIHIAKKELGISDDAYRDIIFSIAGVDSAGKLDAGGRVELLRHFGQLGWGAKPDRPPQSTAPGSRQAAKIRAMWRSLHLAGKVKDSADSALYAFCRRMTEVDRPEWMTPKQANVVIEALKSWSQRPPANAELS